MRYFQDSTTRPGNAHRRASPSAARPGRRAALLCATALCSALGLAPTLADETYASNQTVIGGAGGTLGSPKNVAGDFLIDGRSADVSVTVSAGGVMSSTTNGFVSGSAATTGSLIVTGSGSRFNVGGSLFFTKDQAAMRVEDGGQVFVNGVGQLGAAATSTSNVIVTGNGSLWETGGDIGVTTISGSRGTLTVADGAVVRSGAGGSGSINLATYSDSEAVLNIGAGEGEAAVAAGSLHTAGVQVGAGTGKLVFNHTDSGYTFSHDVSLGTGWLRLLHLSGTTIITGAVATKSNNSYTDPNDVRSEVGVEGGTLRIEGGGTLTLGKGSLNLGGSVGKEGMFVVSGSGSTANLTGTGGNIGVYGKGTALVTDSGELTGTAIDIAWFSGSVGNLMVSGSGSLFSPESSIVGYEGDASLTLTNGAVARIDSGNGTLTVARQSGSRGALNIGAVAGTAAATAGALEAATVAFGAGTGSVVFNHTETAYDFNADVTGSGTMAFHSGVTTLTGDYSGFTGTAEIYKSGTFNLTSAYIGGIGLHDGVTYAANSSLSNDFSVYSGGMLGGSGTVGDVKIASGGTLAPGNSIGTLKTGDVTFAAGASYQVEVNDSGKSDKVVSSGTVSIDSGATLSVLAENATDDGPTYSTSTVYPVLSASSLKGEFGTVSENFAFLDASVNYTGTTANLVLTRTAGGFASSVSTPNRKSVANAVGTLGSGMLLSAVETMRDGEQEQAFQELSGETHATMQGAFIAGAGINRLAMNQRLLTATGNVAGATGGQVSMAFHGEGGPSALEQLKAQAWGTTFGGWSKVDATSRTASLESYGGGFLTGFDAEVLAGWRTGVIAGYSRTQFDSSENRSSGSADSYHVGAYAGSQMGAVGLRLGASYTWHDLETSRRVSFTGFSDRLAADYAASTAQAFVEVGYAVALASASVEPFAGIAAISQHTDGFTETGGSAALVSGSDDNLMGVTTLGLRGVAPIGSVNGISASLTGSMAWRHAFGDVDPSSTVRFAAGGDAFTVDGAPIDADTALFEAGLSLERDESLGLSVSYHGELGADAQDHSGRLNLRYRF